MPLDYNDSHAKVSKFFQAANNHWSKEINRYLPKKIIDSTVLQSEKNCA